MRSSARGIAMGRACHHRRGDAFRCKYGLSNCFWVLNGYFIVLISLKMSIARRFCRR